MKKIGVAGTGNMGRAIVEGLLASGKADPSALAVYDKDPRRVEELVEQWGITAATGNGALAACSDVVVVAVKPADVPSVLREMAPCLGEGTVVVSVAAGVGTDAVSRGLGGWPKVARAMPNTPALVGAGATALYFTPQLQAEEREFVLGMFSAVGIAVEVEREELLDAVTALSGSGPAFVALFVEALADGGVRAGLTRQLALELAVQTVYGAALLLKQRELHPAVLKDMVSSPAGTTIEGLAALEAGAFRGSVVEAVRAAFSRSRKLASGEA